MAALSIGSFGDIAQAARMIIDVGKALQDTGGAEDEYKQVLADLGDLKFLLDELDHISWNGSADSRHFTSLKDMVLTCRAPLSDFVAKIERYKRLDKQNENPGRIRDVANREARKVLWALRMKEDVEKFRDFVAAKATSLSLQLAIITGSATARIERKTNHIEDLQSENAEASKELTIQTSRLRTILSQLLSAFHSFSDFTLHLLRRSLEINLEIYTVVHQIQATISRMPSLAIDDCFRFTDALGRSQYLPYRWFQNWEVFEGMLKHEFRGLPGKERILNGDYHVLDTKGANCIIDQHKWESSVFPGMEVQMSMIISAEVIQGELCPKRECVGKVNGSTPSALAPWTCAKCNAEYTHYHIEQTSRPPADITINLNDLKSCGELQPGTEHPNKLSPGELTRPISMSDLITIVGGTEELKCFKSVHISFGRESGPRTGFLNADGRVSLQTLKWEGYRASQWSIPATLNWLEKNHFPRNFKPVFEELNLQGHRLFRLAESTELLRWKLLQTDEHSHAGWYMGKLDEELGRLARYMRREIRLQHRSNALDQAGTMGGA